jgi:Phosphotransferase enzyme family
MVELQPSKLITRVRFPPPASLSSRAQHELDERVERAVGSTPVRYVARSGGYSTADRFSVELADGRRVFVKSAEDANLAGWLRREHEVYASVEGGFIPRLEGWDDDGRRPVLAIEDLSDADWVPRWDATRVGAVVLALEEIAASAHPANTHPVGVSFPDLFDRWADVAHDPEPFLSAGIRDRAWLDKWLPAIVAAAETVDSSGSSLLHLDVRSDNICFRDGRAILVDWNWATLGNPLLDLAAWLPSLACEGGPKPWDVLPGGAAYGAMVSGVWAAVVGLPPPETAPGVRDVQRRQLEVALAWCERELVR